jgi:GH18 family chitinase
VTYDDADTLKMKANFARKLCLGGVMVWAVSHDTKDAKYSKALAEVAQRTHFPYVEMAKNNKDDGWTFDEKYTQQCRWTNCDENCPGDWIRMMRSDKGARKNEFMVDGSGCDSTSTR